MQKPRPKIGGRREPISSKRQLKNHDRADRVERINHPVDELAKIHRRMMDPMPPSIEKTEVFGVKISNELCSAG